MTDLIQDEGTDAATAEVVETIVSKVPMPRKSSRALKADRLALEEEIEQQLGFVREPGGRRYMLAKQAVMRRDIMTEEDQLKWLRRIGDRRW